MLRSLLPIVLVILLATGGATAWIVYRVMHPHPKPYLLTPENFTQLSARGVKATEETWPNHDGTMSRGWLLRGAEGAPAVVLLHKYESDRSWFLNLGVKLNEQTNFTVLWPDLRGHGENPPVKSSALGFKEGDDTAAAIEYLRTLKTPSGRMVVGQKFGIFGCELGAYAALRAAEKDDRISALSLDSVPAGPDEITRLAVRTQMDIDNKVVQSLARLGMQAWLMGSYEDRSSCALASGMSSKSVLLLSGEAAGPLRESTNALAQCFPQPANKVDVQSSLPLTGFNLHPSTGQQEEAYDRRVIEFFDRALRISR